MQDEPRRRVAVAGGGWIRRSVPGATLEFGVTCEKGGRTPLSLDLATLIFTSDKAPGEQAYLKTKSGMGKSGMHRHPRRRRKPGVENPAWEENSAAAEAPDEEQKNSAGGHLRRDPGPAKLWRRDSSREAKAQEPRGRVAWAPTLRRKRKVERGVAAASEAVKPTTTRKTVGKVWLERSLENETTDGRRTRRKTVVLQLVSAAGSCACRRVDLRPRS